MAAKILAFFYDGEPIMCMRVWSSGPH